MRYGLPYKGSKNGIAEWIVESEHMTSWMILTSFEYRVILRNR